MLLALASVALAAPDRIASTFTVGTEVTDIAATDDGAWVGFTDKGAGTFTILDTGSWQPSVVSVCTDIRGAAAATLADGSWEFYTGCGDGTVVVIDVAADGTISHSKDPVTVGTGQVYGVETDGTDVFAVVEDETDGTIVAVFDAATGGDAGLSGFPVALTNDTVEDTAIVGTTLVITSGTDDVSKIDLATGTLVTPQGTLGARTYTDIWPYETTAAYLADTGGGLVRFVPGSNDYVSSLVGITDTITSVAIDDSDSSDSYLLMGAGDSTLLYSFSGGPGTEQGTISGAANIDEFAVIDGYALGATSDGLVYVLTDRPWVAVEEVSPTSAVSGDTISVSFASDTSGTYEVVLGGTSAADGTVLASGDVTANTTESVDVTVDGDWVEGDNRVWVFVTADSKVGHAAGTVLVDNPPSTVSLPASAVGFGDESISVDFDGIEDADLSYYVLFVSVEPFTAEEYPTGGPDFTGDDDITAPLVITALPGVSVSRTIYPVTNGVTYYVAVRAYDAGGLEGEMSNVQSVTPEQTYSASQLAGDQGVYCGVGPRAGAAALLLAALAVSRRRRVARVVGAGLALATLAVPAAQAKDTDTPRTMNLQMRYGPITIKDPYVDQIFGDKATDILWLEYGFASQFVDADVGVGFFQELSFLQTADGTVSDEHDMFTMFPITLSVTGRLDFFKEQPIVPFGRIGGDYWMWRENWYVPDATLESSRDGGKPGWHFGGGIMLLLDGLDRAAASKLEANAGIDDTYLVAEYRKTLLLQRNDQELDLSSDEITFGLKFDF